MPSLPRVRVRFEAVHHGVTVLAGDDLDDVLRCARDSMRERIPSTAREGARLRLSYGFTITMRVVSGDGEQSLAEWLSIHAVFERAAATASSGRAS